MNQLDKLSANRLSVAFVSGNFNVVHPGHLRLLRFAAEVADRLIVGLNPDDVSGITVPQRLRLEALEVITLVDEVVCLESSPQNHIAELKPDFVVKGREHEEMFNPESEVVAAYGGKLLFGSGEEHFSSQYLLRQEYLNRPLPILELPKSYAKRHGFRVENLTKSLNALDGCKVLVVGDLIVDEYIDCEPLGMSQEDPTIVVTPMDTKDFVGGAGVVAAHAAGLGGRVDYVTVTGQDETANNAAKSLHDYGVNTHFITDTTRPTSRKQRYRANGKTLLRVSHLRQHAIEKTIADALIGSVEERIKDLDCLLFSDFNYGCLPQRVVDEISALAQTHGVLMAADSQASSQLSDISRFRGVSLITPTEREMRLALNDAEAGLASLVQRLQKKAKVEHVIVTLGREGLMLFAPGAATIKEDRLPALNSAPRDVAGAGDSLFALTTMALSAGVDIWEAVYLGSIAAACQVSRIGNTPLTTTELVKEIDLCC